MVFLYAFNRGEPSKQSQALAVFDHPAVNSLGGVLDVSRVTLSDVQFSCGG